MDKPIFEECYNYIHAVSCIARCCLAWLDSIDRDLSQRTNRLTPLLVSTLDFDWQVKVTDVR
jgi:hypothetical protein